MNIGKPELVDIISSKADISKVAAQAAVDALFDTITDAMVAGDKVAIIGFGSFETGKRAARMGRNPRTGETMQIAASVSARFKPGKKLKDALNK